MVRTNIHALSGIRTHSLSVKASKAQIARPLGLTEVILFVRMVKHGATDGLWLGWLWSQEINTEFLKKVDLDCLEGDGSYGGCMRE
jgi:hypothetical protein